MLRRFGGIGLFLLGGVLAAGFVGGMLATPKPTMAMPIAIPTPSVTAAVTAAVTPTVKPVNSKVEPGKVHWHATTELAFAAAKVSKKPVLVFHMMGQLDHQFC